MKKLPKIKKDALLGRARQYLKMRKEIKAQEKIQAEISTELKEAAEQYGVADGHSFALDLDEIKVKKVGAVKNVVDIAKAVKRLKELDLLDRCTKRVLDEEALELAFQEGLIDMDDINGFTSETVSYRIDVR